MTQSLICGDDATVAYPLFQEGNGGSIPTSPLQFTFAPISRNVMEALNRKWHSRLPILKTACPCSIYYGAEYDGVYYAVAAWSPPVARLLPTDWLELRRLAIAENAPRNTATRMLGWMARDIKKRFPHVIRLVSYQDTEVHTGGIYKAAGWTMTTIRGRGEWSRPSRPRAKAQSSSPKQRWERDIAKSDSGSSAKGREAMNLREVREAAERIDASNVKDVDIVCQHIFATIDPSPDGNVDSEWLKEEWGAWRHMQPASDFNLTIGKGAIRLIYYFDFDPSKVKWSINTDDNAMWLPLNIKNRQQFTQLALALGIDKIKRVSECSNTR